MWFTSIIYILAGLGLLFLLRILMDTPTRQEERGFWDISHPFHIRFIKLNSGDKNLAEWAERKKIVSYIPRYWRRVYFSHRDLLMIDDRNYREYTLRNRRRLKKALIYHEDVLDFGGQATFLYNEPRISDRRVVHNRAGSEMSLLHTTDLAKTPILRPSDPKAKTVYISNNVTYIGRSRANDLVLHDHTVEPYHAKILFVLGRAKLINLSKEGTTFVNSKRIEEMYLGNNDEIGFNSQKFYFKQINSVNISAKDKLDEWRLTGGN